MSIQKKCLTLQPQNHHAQHIKGEMAEWSIAAVLKTVEGHTSGGSNPSLSATEQTQRRDTPALRLFLYNSVTARVKMCRICAPNVTDNRMKDFAAIDFETANNERSSVCSVGVVIVRDGEIVGTYYSLIRPEPEYYSYWCSRVHGLRRDDTSDAPIFPAVWRKIEPMIAGLPLVAHNSPFDEGCLRAVFRVYQMDYPDYDFYDTLSASRRVMPHLANHQLHTVAAACGFHLDRHHHALADAEACAWIARQIL